MGHVARGADPAYASYSQLHTTSGLLPLIIRIVEYGETKVFEHLKVSLTLVVVDIFISNCRFPGMHHVLGTVLSSLYTELSRLSSSQLGKLRPTQG